MTPRGGLTSEIDTMDFGELIDGEFVGMMTPYMIEVFYRAVEAGYARASYEGVGGFLGLAKVRLNRERQP
jgi:hypothetical protein